MIRAHASVLGVALLAYTALAVGYATQTPLWQNPDEPAHFNYVVHVARTATLPELQPGDWDSALLERLQNGRLLPTDSVETIRYESWQPPLYYVLAAPLVRLFPMDVSATLQRLRLFGVLLGGLTLIVAYRAAFEVLPRELTPAVPLTMAGVPMFTAVSASVSADPLANLLAALIVLALLHHLLSERRGARAWAALGALLGLGLLAKLALAIFVPLVAWVILARSRRPLRDLPIAFGTSLLVLSPWLIHQVTTYGWADPLAMTRHAEVVSDQPRFAGFSPAFVADFLGITFRSFWAQFGWMAAPAPDRLYWIWGAALVVAVIGLLRRARCVRRPPWLLLVGTVCAAFVALVAYNLGFTQYQGRYLFTALVPIAVLCVAGWSAWLPASSRWRPIGSFGIAIALVALNAFAFWRVLIPAFTPVR